MIVSYDGNGNTGGTVPASTTHTVGDVVILPDPGTLVRSGYTFYGWNTTSGGTGDFYLPDNGYRVPITDVTFYATWLINYTGGLSGALVGGSINDSFWDTEASGQSTSAAGVGKTTEEMHTETTFTNWDFVDTWIMEDGVSYPSFYKVDFSVNITTGNYPLTVSFSNDTIRWPDVDAPVVTHYWNFGDGNISTELNPTHVYALPGMYSVYLIESRNYLEEIVIKEGYITVIDPTGGYHLISETSTLGGGFARYRGPTLIFD